MPRLGLEAGVPGRRTLNRANRDRERAVTAMVRVSGCGIGGSSFRLSGFSRVADHLAARIVAGDLRLGTRLPGERDLAAEYEVALGTARRAVSELRRRGLAVTLPSKGTFVVSTLPSE